MKESKSEKVSFRLSESLYNDLKLEADEKELTLSRWILTILEQRPQKKKDVKEAEKTNWLLAVICLVLMLLYGVYIKTRRVFN